MKKFSSIVFILILMTLQLTFAIGMTVEKCCMDKFEKVTNANHACCNNDSNEDNCPINDLQHCNCNYNVTFISSQVEMNFAIPEFYIKPVAYMNVGDTISFLSDIFQPPWV